MTKPKLEMHKLTHFADKTSHKVSMALQLMHEAEYNYELGNATNKWTRYNKTKKHVYTQARQVLAERLWKYVGSGEHHEKRGGKIDVRHRALLPPRNGRTVHIEG
uniref:Uncharacterized protein n=1 Tax=Rhipicephalus zambeziensis TaxID=60191 RepID=A0A224YAF7_9ACAR